MTDVRDDVVKRALTEIRELRVALQRSEETRSEPIAVVGMACRVPGADSPDEFWDMLRRGGDPITDIPGSRWDVDAFYSADPSVPGRSYTRRGGFLPDIDRFDASLFGVSPREAAHMDPQQRLFLEVAWSALEDAAIPADQLTGTRTGVFVGVTGFDYSQRAMSDLDPAHLDAYVLTGTASTFTAGRLAFALGLQGPSLSVDTACSSSLVAVHLAVQSLRAGDCTVALAGGVNALLAPEPFVVLCKAQMLAPNGQCKTFDASADGYGRSEGCGVVVLKRLSTAVADGDRVLAVLRGSAVNQDGRSSGITVPNPAAQQAVVRQALATAGLTPDRVGYVETHGTGTPLGDPIEVRALSAVLAPGRTAPLPLGSAKATVGHLESAAGVVGLIKAVLALRNEEIPPLAHLRSVNPAIDMDALRVTLPTSPLPWPRGGAPRVAGVSSFGASGTNCHVVLEEAPPLPVRDTGPDRSAHLLTLTAQNTEALVALARRYADHLGGDPPDLGDLAFTVNTGRARLPHRLAVCAGSAAELRDILDAHLSGRRSTDVATGTVKARSRPKVAFLFSGQGAQYAGMARELYGSEPGFRADLDRCAELLADRLDRPLRDVLFGADTALLDHTRYTQPGLFAVQYALARLWQRWGVRPTALLGHSVGEYAAACVAGVFSLEEGIALIADRAALMDDLPAGGAMAAVFTDRETAAKALQGRESTVAIAAVNGPGHVVLSGAAADLDEVLAGLDADGVRFRRLVVSHAFHSPLLDPALDALERRAARVTYRAPEIPLVANLTGAVSRPDTIDAAYLRAHAREPVRFADGVRVLEELGCELLVEIGPGAQLAGIVATAFPESRLRPLASLRRDGGDWRNLLRALAQLSVAGVPVDWRAFDAPFRRRRIGPLPTYPFERTRYWYTAEPGRPETVAAGPPRAESDRRLLGARLSSPLDTAQFQAELSTQVHPGLADCRSGDLAIVNAGFYVETVVQAVEELHRTTQTRIDGFVMPQALLVPADGRLSTQLVTIPDGGFSYHSRTGATWTAHARGAYRTEVAARVDLDRAQLDAIADRCGTTVSGSAFYRGLWQRGVQLGPSAQWITRLVRRDGEVLAHLRTATEEEAGNGYHLHPGIVDTALQTLFAAAPRGWPADAVLILLEIEEYTFYGHDGGPLLCHTVLRKSGGAADILAADLVLVTPDGRRVATFHGVHMKAAAAEAMARAITAAHGAPSRARSAAPRPQRRDVLAGGEPAVRTYLVEATATVLGLGTADVEPDRPLTDLGMDSLLAVELRDAVGAAVGGVLPMAWFLGGPTVDDLVARILGSARPAADPTGARRRTGPSGMRYTEHGTGAPVVFVHGGAFGGTDSWQTQLPLAERWRLVVVSRPGYDDSPVDGEEDWERDGRLLAELLEGFDDGAHLVAQSYGTLGAMHAVTLCPGAARSLTLVESAASAVARGVPVVDDYERTMRDLVAGPRDDADAFFRALFAAIDPATRFPSPLPEALQAYAERSVRGTRWPWEAEAPVGALRAAGVPMLVVSGGQRPLFEAISDVLARKLGARRAVVPGGHGTQNAGEPFNLVLEEFLSRCGGKP